MNAKAKATLFWGIMLVATWLAIEGLSFVAYRVINHSFFTYPQALQSLSARAATVEPGQGVNGLAEIKWTDFVEILHPYFGFVADPYQNKPMWKVSDYGFAMGGNVNPIVKRSPEKIVIGFFGGSLASVIYPALQTLWQQKAAVPGKECVLINFAGGGYKQPQQLMILSYLLALGAEFDFVINLDGFNEVVLPPTENIPSHVNPFYPRGWDRRTASAINPGTVRLIGTVEVTRQKQEKLAEVVKTRRLYLSPTLFLLWQYRDRQLARAIYKTNEQLRRESAKTQTYTMQGPAYVYPDEGALYRDLVGVWQRSSGQMKALCDASGARYYHFLQPNQYIKDTKPMSAAERWLTRNEASPYKPSVAQGYPRLIRAGVELKAAGENFVDLTAIFAGHPETLYIDDCCHTNAAGSALIAQRISDTIRP